MDGIDVMAIAGINILTIVATVYYLKGKVEQMNKQYQYEQQQLIKYIDARISDLKEYVSDRFNDLYKMFNTRIRSIEHIVYKED